MEETKTKDRTILGMKIWVFILLCIGLLTLLGGGGYLLLNRKKKEKDGSSDTSAMTNAKNAISRFDSSRDSFNRLEE